MWMNSLHVSSSVLQKRFTSIGNDYAMNLHNNEHMNAFAQESRRQFLTTTASGLGMMGLGSVLAQDGLLSPQTASAASDVNVTNPLAPKDGHFKPKAKAVISIFMAGAPSQLDLFDPKPELHKLHGQPIPKSLIEGVRFAFLKPDTATLLAPLNRTFKKHGECGMEMSDLLPNIGSCADDIALIRSMHSSQFNHHPGQLLMQCGREIFGLPTMGAWMTYGLGSESQNLPGYVVLTAGRGSSGGATLWQSGFLPSVHAGVRFRNEGEPVLNLNNPAGLPPSLQRKGLDTLRSLNQERLNKMRDPEIASRIASYELASRMQSAAPELSDLSDETQETLDLYGVGRKTPDANGNRGASKDVYDVYARNCLLARRLVERGVRCVNIIHASWDHHSKLDSNLEYNTQMCDQPIAALIKDLKRRGLLDETLVTWTSEFGRTPLGENRTGFKTVTGRDHHPYSFSTFLAGGGVKGGQVIGKTDEIGWGIVEDPIHVNDYHATMLHLFGLDHKKLTYRHQGRDFRLTDVAGKVIDRLIA